MMFIQAGCRLDGDFFLMLKLNRLAHILIDCRRMHFLNFKHWLDCLLPLGYIGSLLLLTDDQLLGTAELNVVGLSVRARLLLLALLLLDSLLQLFLKLTHEVVVIAEFGVECLAATLGALLQTLLKHFLNALDFLTYDLIEDLVLLGFVVVSADVWVSRVPRIGY